MRDHSPPSASLSWADRLRQFARPLAYALLAFAVFHWFARGESGPKAGQSASEFSLAAADGSATRVTLAELRGSPVVIEVIASWCGACRSMAPTMAELANAQRKRPVHFVAVAVDTAPEEAAKLRQSWGIPFSIVMGDGKFTSDYRVSVLPTVIVLDAEGRVHKVTSGGTRKSVLDGWLEDLGAARL
jgi:thiol-disulfide isomerase/thioredoxin